MTTKILTRQRVTTISLLVVFASSTLLGGCSEASRGAAGGAWLGALAGGIIGHQSGETGEGAAIGAAAGAALGYVIGNEADKQNAGYYDDGYDYESGPYREVEIREYHYYHHPRFYRRHYHHYDY